MYNNLFLEPTLQMTGAAVAFTVQQEGVTYCHTPHSTQLNSTASLKRNEILEQSKAASSAEEASVILATEHHVLQLSLLAYILYNMAQ
jgi:hypothetical protein